MRVCFCARSDIARQCPSSKRQQRHPVLRVRDRERQKRRQKKEVEHSAATPTYKSRPAGPTTPTQTESQSTAQRHRRRVHMQMPKVHLHDQRHHRASSNIWQNLSKQAFLHPCIIARAIRANIRILFQELTSHSKIRDLGAPFRPRRCGMNGHRAHRFPQTSSRHLDRSSEPPRCVSGERPRRCRCLFLPLPLFIFAVILSASKDPIPIALPIPFAPFPHLSPRRCPLIPFPPPCLSDIR